MQARLPWPGRALGAVLVVRLAVLLLPGTAAAGIDFGPTYGRDYAGMDYNVTLWHSPSSMSANHWEAAAKACEAYCLNDPQCITWTYCTPEVGSKDPERCCLKNGIPQEVEVATHWTGAAPRAKNWTQPMPKIHFSPQCLHEVGWHDIAAALTFNGKHNVFQGCPAAGGWHHGQSTDLVHWTSMGLGVHAINETYRGMESDTSPCSGFMTVDDDGTPCAGFRQCTSTKGLSHPWDVPLELRCAQNANLTSWSDPIYIYDVYFNRGLPYDPTRPWKGRDGYWYSTIAMDACNGTTRDCLAGSADYLWRSKRLHGAGADWEPVGVLFATNRTVLDHGPAGGPRHCEFVTPNYIGGLRGDPRGGATRIFTDNGQGGYTMYFIGTQPVEGQPFEVDFSQSNTVGAVDYGAFTPTAQGVGLAGLADSQGMIYGMARTLGGAPDQVTTPDQRHVIFAWLNMGSVTSMTLGRDLSLAADSSLLQSFVPELAQLRIDSQHTRLSGGGSSGSSSSSSRAATLSAATQSYQFEFVFELELAVGANGSAGVQLLTCGAGADAEFVRIGADLARQHVFVDATAMHNPAVRAGPLLFDPASPRRLHVHGYVDHVVTEVIFNNRTAITVATTPPTGQICTGVSVFGIDSLTHFDLDFWDLETANDNQP